MQKYRLLFSYLGTASIYGAVFVLLFYLPSTQIVAKEKSQEKRIELSLSTFVPEVIPPPKIEKKIPKKEKFSKAKALEKAKETKPMFPKVPLIEKKKVPKKKIIKKKIIKKKLSNKKIKKKIEKKIKNKKRLKRTKRLHKTKKKTRRKKSLAQKSSRKQRKSSKAKKNAFLAKIRATINANKSYPRIAKKRRMQGWVKAKFTILSSGRIGKISLTGKKVFFSSAKRAVKSAFPVNTGKSPLSLPMSISLTLHYRLH